MARSHERIGFLGWSIFSLVGLDFALAYPDSVSRLILIGALPSLGSADDGDWDTVASPERKARLAENLPESNGAAWSPCHPARQNLTNLSAAGHSRCGMPPTALATGTTPPSIARRATQTTNGIWLDGTGSGRNWRRLTQTRRRSRA